MWRGFTTARCTAFQEATMGNLCKRGIENIGFSSHVCYDFSSILRHRRLHFRGLGHPSVAFWTLWVTRLIPGCHFVNLFVDIGRLRAPKWVTRAAGGTPKNHKRVLSGYPLQHFSQKKWMRGERAYIWRYFFDFRRISGRPNPRSAAAGAVQTMFFHFDICFRNEPENMIFEVFGTQFSWTSLILSCVATKLMQKDTKLEMCFFMFFCVILRL